MSQKRNQISSEAVLAASKILRSDAGHLAIDVLVTDFEQAWVGALAWHLGWVAFPNSFLIACGALHQIKNNFALAGLVVKVDTMLDNLNPTRGSDRC